MSCISCRDYTSMLVDLLLFIDINEYLNFLCAFSSTVLRFFKYLSRSQNFSRNPQSYSSCQLLRRCVRKMRVSNLTLEPKYTISKHNYITLHLFALKNTLEHLIRYVRLLHRLRYQTLKLPRNLLYRREHYRMVSKDLRERSMTDP